jgi:hypothetical protein
MSGLRGSASKSPDQPRGLTTTRGDVAWTQRVGHCPAVGGLFFPQNHALGVDPSGFSPRLPQTIVHAGVNSASYLQASRGLAALADLNVKPKPVERLVQTIGRERIDQRLPLMAKDADADPNRPCPKVAMVSVDGGRIQIRAEAPNCPADSRHSTP